MGEIFESIYQQNDEPPWNQSGPVAIVVQLQQEGAFSGRVLDSGCGTGENALYLAAQGLDVVGVDGSPTAVDRARRKADERGIEAVFATGDTRKLDGFTDEFDTVLDCGMFHTFGTAGDGRRYSSALHRACRKGAVVHLLGFRHDNTGPGAAPRRDRRRPTGCGTHAVSEMEIRAAFEREWKLVSLRPLTITQTVGDMRHELPYFLAKLQRH
jgi:SAM-dependent methyltransferase